MGLEPLLSGGVHATTMLLLVGEDRVIDATADGVKPFAGATCDVAGTLAPPSLLAPGGGGLLVPVPFPPPQDASSVANTITRTALNMFMASLWRINMRYVAALSCGKN